MRVPQHLYLKMCWFLHICYIPRLWVGVYPAKGEGGVKGFSPGEAQGLRIKQIHENSIKPKPLLFHKYLIAAKGLLLIDNMYLDELRENLKVSRFLLIVIPLNMEGVTALPVNPIVRI